MASAKNVMDVLAGAPIAETSSSDRIVLELGRWLLHEFLDGRGVSFRC